jgi:hypothetical protein
MITQDKEQGYVISLMNRQFHNIRKCLVHSNKEQTVSDTMHADMFMLCTLCKERIKIRRISVAQIIVNDNRRLL